MHLTPTSWVAYHARRQPKQEACVDGEVRLSYAELDRVTDSLGAAFRNEGVLPGDRVCLLLENSMRFIIAYLALLRIEAVAVPLNPGGPAASVIELIEDASPIAVLCGSQISGKSLSTMLAGSEARSIRFPGLAQSVDMLQPTGPGLTVSQASEPAERLATIIYTSGTTGRAKGVMLTARNMAAIAQAGCKLLKLRRHDRIGVVTPLFHLYSLRDVDACLQSGATLVVCRRSMYPAQVLKELHAERVTGLSAVPSGMMLTTERYQELLSACGEHLRYVALGTATPSASLLCELRAALPKTRLLVTYGLTEASRVCYREVFDPDTEVGSVGRPYPGVTISMRDDWGSPVPPGTTGRIAVRSAMVMQGYFREPALTASVLQADRTLLTPDCARQGADGSLFLLGRIDEVINSGGEKISPDQIEAVLKTHSRIADAAVTGCPDPAGIMGEVAMAYVVTRPGVHLDAEAVRRYCAERLDWWKVPSIVVFRDFLPKSVLGKTVRPLLQKGASDAGHERATAREER